MVTRKKTDEILELLHSEVKPALGCTEPIAVALAVAKSCELLRTKGVEPENIDVEVSGNVLKNGMGVGIPGTGMVGLHVASALSQVCGKSEYKLEVFRDLTSDAVAKAKGIVAEKRVKISVANTPQKLYVAAVVRNGDDYARTVIQGCHDNIVYYGVNGEAIYEVDTAPKCYPGSDSGAGDENNVELDVRTIWDFVHEVPLHDIEFMLEAASMNKELAKEGLLHDYGLKVGKTIQANIHRDVFGHGLLTHSMALTAAASDARMAGCTLPAMSNSGSGNQGITVTMPVVAAAEKMMSSYEDLARALTLSHLVAIHIKQYLGRLSALCGCVVASTGSACGIVYLSGGNYDQVCYSIKNMIGNITGMVCDGAKVGCALKVSSAVQSAVQAAILALENICISEDEGIIEGCVEQTIRNLATIGSQGMKETDDLILDIMCN